MTGEVVLALEKCRAAEKEQALFYRGLAAAAEERDDAALAERFHGLHADEQHHLSRLTARLVDEGERPEELALARVPTTVLDGWEAVARQREHDEMARYEVLLERELDAATRALISATLDVERHHAKDLGGKWTLA